MAIQLNNAFLRSVISEHGLGLAEKNKLHLFGVDGALPVGEISLRETADKLDAWDSTIGTFGTALWLGRGTTDPGRGPTAKPTNAKGAAHLVPGAWPYKLGLHKGAKALVQNGSVTVIRDKDRDGTPEAGEPVDKGWFGINIHKGGKSTLPVGSWSAGCQVLTAEAWPAFYALCVQSGQQTFTYYLLAHKWLFP
jgi:hypothetical protein